MDPVTIAAIGTALGALSGPEAAQPGDIIRQGGGPITIGGNNAPVWADPIRGGFGTPPSTQFAQAITQPFNNLTANPWVAVALGGLLIVLLVRR